MNSFIKRLIGPLLIVSCITSFQAPAGLFAQTENAPKIDKRVSVPPANAVKNATAQLNEVYKAQFFKARGSREPNVKSDLANLLIKQAHDPANDLVSRYVCLVEARKLMEAAGDLHGTMRCIDGISQSFKVDELPLKIASLKAVVTKPKPDNQLIARYGLQFASEAEQAGKFDVIGELLDLALGAAQRGKAKDLIRLAIEEKALFPDLKKTYDANTKALATLAKDPDDPESNAVAGRYNCLVKGDWATGTAQLEKGNDPGLKELAALEAKNPIELKEIVSLAEAWQKSGELEKGALRIRMLRESAYWYKIASLQAPGLQKATYEKLSQQAAGRSPRNTSSTGLIQTIYEGPDFNKQRVVQIAPKIHENYGNGSAGPDLPGDNFSVVWTGLIKVPESATYAISLNHDDGGRVWIDTLSLVDNWGGAGHDIREIELTAGFHAVRVEYNERGGSAGVALSWKRAGSPAEFEPIPDTWFFHDPNIARASGVKKP